MKITLGCENHSRSGKLYKGSPPPYAFQKELILSISGIPGVSEVEVMSRCHLVLLSSKNEMIIQPKRKSRALAGEGIR